MESPSNPIEVKPLPDLVLGFGVTVILLLKMLLFLDLIAVEKVYTEEEQWQRLVDFSWYLKDPDIDAQSSTKPAICFKGPDSSPDMHPSLVGFWKWSQDQDTTGISPEMLARRYLFKYQGIKFIPNHAK